MKNKGLLTSLDLSLEIEVRIFSGAEPVFVRISAAGANLRSTNAPFAREILRIPLTQGFAV